MDEMRILLSRKLGEQISCDDFRQAYEELYNFRLDLSRLSGEESEALADFFDVVTRYSPIEQDRTKYPGTYRDEEQVGVALEALREKLGVSVP